MTTFELDNVFNDSVLDNLLNHTELDNLFNERTKLIDNIIMRIAKENKINYSREAKYTNNFEFTEEDEKSIKFVNEDINSLMKKMSESAEVINMKLMIQTFRFGFYIIYGILRDGTYVCIGHYNAVNIKNNNNLLLKHPKKDIYFKPHISGEEYLEPPSVSTPTYRYINSLIRYKNYGNNVKILSSLVPYAEQLYYYNLFTYKKVKDIVPNFPKFHDLAYESRKMNRF